MSPPKAPGSFRCLAPPGVYAFGYRHTEQFSCLAEASVNTADREFAAICVVP